MGTQLPLPKKGAEPPPNFQPISILWPNCWMHQDATRYGGRLQPRRVCVRWGPSPSPILRVEVENFEIGPVIADFVALEQQMILVKTRSESV